MRPTFVLNFTLMQSAVIFFFLTNKSSNSSRKIPSTNFTVSPVMCYISAANPSEQIVQVFSMG